MKVLVIDDEQMIRDLAWRILKRSGFEVVVTETGQEGINIFETECENIGCVLLDLTLEDIPGLEVLRHLREIEPSVPCILSSGRAFEEIDIPADLQNNTYFLEKPYRAGQLSELVEKLLITEK